MSTNIISFFLPLLLGFVSVYGCPKITTCKCTPFDPCWPSQAAWSTLNETVDGRLIATIPLGSPCHEPTFNATECEYLQEHWIDPTLHLPSSSSVMAPFYANRSCDPFTTTDSPCLLGNYVAYAINVSETAHIVAGLQFAQEHNIRLVVRNTGHDYLGKSTGAFALGIWTHYLKSIEFIDYNRTYYTGKAIKMGSGVEGFEANAAGQVAGYQIVGGECPTVGIAGGYTQGGGHSVLGSYHGLGADQTLEFEVVLANGSIVTASPEENKDLFWAMSGGGGGTYGISVSVTSRAHPDTNVTAAWIVMNQTASPDNASYYDAISSFYALSPAITAANGTVVSFAAPDSFSVAPAVFPAAASEEIVRAILKPYTDKLTAFNISHSYTLTTFPDYRTFFDTAWPDLDFFAVGVDQYGSYLLPRNIYTSNENLSKLNSIISDFNSQGATLTSVVIDVSRFATQSDGIRAVLPAWRNALSHSIVFSPWSFDPSAWDQMLENQRTITNNVFKLKAIAPNSGAYVNEGDGNEPEWKEVFWGSNYEGLLEVKKKYDPEFLFFANRAVGSDYWTVDESGKMCKSFVGQ
ncbi:hypothetical protein GYMLUDRAFT_53027 [Collybiopsis luxurians FD-317 M1]|nr:hypothetical protein GYMLUDRAFT_53027 [Collybiopsis luxurians FD-317 M1]